MSLKIMKMLADVAPMQYYLRWCHVTAILQVLWIKIESPLIYCVNELIWHNNVPHEHEDVYQYGSFAIPSKTMPYQSYPEILVNQNENPIELMC